MQLSSLLTAADRQRVASLPDHFETAAGLEAQTLEAQTLKAPTLKAPTLKALTLEAPTLKALDPGWLRQRTARKLHESART